ncbi:hypothetical protein EQG41_15865 [Billgrantia azerbaijanica]|nr:hypothetical protein EQG41_15865 [Halomonas azerbaijanica]
MADDYLGGLMTIVEAIIKVMHNAGRPLSPKESYEAVIDSGLYSFNSDNPIHVVRSQIRRHCKGCEFDSSSPRKYFYEVEVGKYSPLKNFFPVRM